MATYTSYLNLKKPEGGERYALADFNANMQKIDEAFAHLIDPSSNASDLNNCKTLGFYRSAPSTSNNPVSGYFSILVIPFVGNRDIAQIATEVNTNKTFVRTLHDSSTWTAWKELADASQLTSSSVNCEQYCSSSETEAVTRLFCYGKTRILSFMGTSRVHAEDEVIMTLPSEHRPVGQVLVYGNGSIKGIPVALRYNGGTGQITLYLINGATSSNRLYFQMSWVVA